MPKISRFYFMAAICFLIVGVLLGLKMSIAHDFSAAPAHAHINLLGWVTCALFGTYHALSPAGASSRFAQLQAYSYVVGVAIMTSSLYLLHTGVQGVGPVVAVGSIVVFVAILMFGLIIFRAPLATSHSNE